MLRHISAREYEETPHANKGSKNKTLNLNGTGKTKISNALRRRAQSVIKDRSIDAQSRALIHYALETNDPWLAELVRRADAGETIIDRGGLLANTRSLRSRFNRMKD